MVSYSLAWHIVRKDGNPEKSGDYLVMTRGGYIWTLPYSTVHDAWNTRDYETKEEASRVIINQIVAWAEIGFMNKGLLEEVEK